MKNYYRIGSVFITVFMLSSLLACEQAEVNAKETAESSKNNVIPKAQKTEPKVQSIKNAEHVTNIDVDVDVDDKAKLAANTKIAPESTYRTLEWTDLIPAKDLEALMNPPEFLNDIEDGSLEDSIASQIQAQLDIDENDPYQQALVSKDVIAAMDGQLIRLPGFLVPLAFGDEEFEITQFFLVPFFGACIHVPPPPPNQIIFIDYPQGIKLTDLQDAFWLEGKLNTTLTENEAATSAYAIELHTIEPYYP